MISWGLSLVGRAPALHAGGQEFDSPSLHHVLIEYGYKLKITEFSKYKLIKFCDLSQLTAVRRGCSESLTDWQKLSLK